ncbi:MAG: septum formation protein Maf [Porticoccaceae bacterium]|nr:septum formation protein Maf [Porticoccaceae bacterium]|tara:strand:+ start:46483 stop:47070 length:588 start_codon:yes stop_codon:yes gene_type:complete
MQPLILASGSIYRAKQLKSLGLKFSIIKSNIEECRLFGESPKSMALRLAKLKALAIANKNLNTLVIGADQVVDIDGLILRKPGNYDHAVAQLKKQSGRNITLNTACAIVSCANNKTPVIQAEVTVAKILFKVITDAQIHRYVTKDKPFNCAGSFKIESLGIAFCEFIKCEDHTSIVGLPLISVIRMLEQFNYEVI